MASNVAAHVLKSYIKYREKGKPMGPLAGVGWWVGGWGGVLRQSSDDEGVREENRRKIEGRDTSRDKRISFPAYFVFIHMGPILYLVTLGPACTSSFCNQFSTRPFSAHPLLAHFGPSLHARILVPFCTYSVLSDVLPILYSIILDPSRIVIMSQII